MRPGWLLAVWLMACRTDVILATLPDASIDHANEVSCPCTGDVNGNGEVEVLDLVQSTECSGLEAVGDCAAADSNCDGTIDLDDAHVVECAFARARPDCCAPVDSDGG